MPIRSIREIPVGRNIRVLVVDDSIVIRRLITQALSEPFTKEIIEDKLRLLGILN